MAATYFHLDQWYGEGTGLYPNTAGLNENGVPKRAPVAKVEVLYYQVLRKMERQMIFVPQTKMATEPYLAIRTAHHVRGMFTTAVT